MLREATANPQQWNYSKLVAAQVVTLKL